MEILAIQTLIGYLITTAISVGLSYLAYSLTPKPKAANQWLDQPNVLSARGSWIPWLCGKRRVGCVFTWAGNRQSRVEKITKGKGQINMDPGTKATVYYECGVHVLCAGPAYALYQIRANEHVIWDQPILRTTSPSGSTFLALDGLSQFKIYWGDQTATNTLLEKYVSYVDEGGTTQHLPVVWPGVCYVLWWPKRLGTGVVWPQMDYVVASQPETVAQLTTAPSYISALSESLDDEGINPAQAIWQMLTASFPMGLGIPASRLDQPSFEACAQTFESEHLPMNVLIENGTDANGALAAMTKQLDMMTPQVRDVIKPYLVRPVPTGTSLPTITPDSDVDPDPEEEQQHGYVAPDRIVFSIQDVYLGYRSYTLPIRRDWQSRYNARNQYMVEQVEQVTDRITLNKIARRRLPQFGVNGHPLKFTVGRDARSPDFHPGIAFVLQGFGQMRLMSKQIATKSSKVQIEAMHDVYSLGTNLTTPVWDGTSEQFDVAEPDLIVSPQVLPPQMATASSAGIQHAIVVPRVRANGAIAGAQVWCHVAVLPTESAAPVAGAPYHQVGSQDMASYGGGLTAVIDGVTGADGTEQATLGAFQCPDPNNADVSLLQDLTGDDDAYDDAQQVVCVDNEIMLVRSFTANLDGSYAMNGVSRAQFGTAAVAHSLGAPVVVFNPSDLTPMSFPAVKAGNELWVKTLPFVPGQIVDITDVSPVRLIIPDDIDAFIEFLSPHAGDVLPDGKLAKVSWRSTGIHGTVLKLYLSVDGGATFGLLATVGDNGNHQFTPASDGSQDSADAYFKLEYLGNYDVQAEIGPVTIGGSDPYGTSGSAPPAFAYVKTDTATGPSWYGAYGSAGCSTADGDTLPSWASALSYDTPGGTTSDGAGNGALVGAPSSGVTQAGTFSGTTSSPLTVDVPVSGPGLVTLAVNCSYGTAEAFPLTVTKLSGGATLWVGTWQVLAGQPSYIQFEIVEGVRFSIAENATTTHPAELQLVLFDAVPG